MGPSGTKRTSRGGGHVKSWRVVRHDWSWPRASTTMRSPNLLCAHVPKLQRTSSMCTVSSFDNVDGFSTQVTTSYDKFSARHPKRLLKNVMLWIGSRRPCRRSGAQSRCCHSTSKSRFTPREHDNRVQRAGTCAVCTADAAQCNHDWILRGFWSSLHTTFCFVRWVGHDWDRHQHG